MQGEGDDAGFLPEGFDRRRVLGLLAVAVLLVLAGCEGRIYERSVCGVCDGVATDEDVSATVEESVIEIRTFENGSSRWTARLDVVGANHSELAGSTDEIEAAVSRERAATTTAHGGDVHRPSVSVEDRTVVVTYRVSDGATARPGGFVVFRYFHRAYRPNGDRYPRPYTLGADEVRVRAPPDKAVVNDPQGATVTEDGRAAVWARRHASHRYEIPADTYVAFGPERTPAHRVASTTLVAGETLGWGGADWLTGAGIAAVLPTLLVAVVGDLATGRGLRRWVRRPSVSRRELWGVGAALGIVGGAIAAHLLTGTFADGVASLALFGAAPVATLVAGGLGYASARGHWAGVPLATLFVALPLYPTAMESFDATAVGGTKAIPLLYGPPVAIFATVTFLIGFKLGGGTFRGD